MCVSLPPRLLITSGVIWAPYDRLNKSYSFYMAVLVIIGGRRGLRIEASRRTNLIRVSYHCKILYFHFNMPFKQLYTSCKTSCKTEHFSYKGGCDVHGHMHIEVFKRAGY